MDLIDRDMACQKMKALYEEDCRMYGVSIPECFDSDRAIEVLKELPPVQPTLCGYNIEHLMLIAVMLRKKSLPPERVTEVLTDIERIVSIVKDEFEESLRKGIEQCKI